MPLARHLSSWLDHTTFLWLPAAARLFLCLDWAAALVFTFLNKYVAPKKNPSEHFSSVTPHAFRPFHPYPLFACESSKWKQLKCPRPNSNRSVFTSIRWCFKVCQLLEYRSGIQTVAGHSWAEATVGCSRATFFQYGVGWGGVITFMWLAPTRDATLLLRLWLGFGWGGYHLVWNKQTLRKVRRPEQK